MSRYSRIRPTTRRGRIQARPRVVVVALALVLVPPLAATLPTIAVAATPVSGDQPAPYEPPAARASSGSAIAGLDSLAAASLLEALDRIAVDPRELGFDKLYAEDDTFRLSIIEEILADPLRLPRLQEELVGAIRASAAAPGLLAEEMGAWLDAPAPARTESVAGFFDACRSAAADIDRAFAGISPDERDRILVLAPAFWADWEEPSEKARKGSLHRSAAVEADTTFEISEDPVLDAAAQVDRAALTAATRTFLDAAMVLADGLRLASAEANSEPLAGLPSELRDEMRPLPRALQAGISGETAGGIDTPWGWLVIGGAGPNAYDMDALANVAFVIDLGGDDVYRGPCASAIAGWSGGAGRPGDRPLAAILDLAGDDLYDAREHPFGLASGLFGIAALIDLHGNDIYRGEDGSCGAGFFGAGLLFDGGGSDLFEGRNLSQGAGAFGFGLLVSLGDALPPAGPEIEEDRAFAAGLTRVPGTGGRAVRYDENDTYIAARQSQGFASTFGAGILYDRFGNDTYRTGGRYLHRPLLPHDFQSLSQGFSIGFRPRAGGGIGILLDEEGNDFYDAEVYAQGTSYWYSLGLLFDGSGNDRYLATQYAQGAGVHLSIGSLWDRGGDDHYIAKFGVTQGTAHDLSVGMLLEEGGNDFYAVSDGQGMSITNSVAIFIDEMGDDLYATPGTGQSATTWARGFAGAGIFLDLEGKDSYPRDARGANGAVWSPDLHAVGIDLDRDLVLPGEVIPEPVLTAADSARTVEELFETASLWEVGSARERVRTARKALIAKGICAVDYAVAEKLADQGGLVYRTVLELGQAYPDSMAARILPRLRGESDPVQRTIIALLGDLKRTEAREPLESLLQDPTEEDDWVRVIRALGELGDRDAAPALRPFLRDADERRRIYTVAALAALRDTASVPAFVSLLRDPELTVRSAAYAALPRFGRVAAEPLAAAYDAGPPRPAEVRAIGRMVAALADSTGAEDLRARHTGRQRLLSALEARDPSVRATAAEFLLELDEPATTHEVRLRLLDEPDPAVRRVLEIENESAP